MVITISTRYTLYTVITVKPCFSASCILEIYDSYHNYHKSTIYHKFVRLSTKKSPEMVGQKETGVVP
jgi:hypothetical protein